MTERFRRGLGWLAVGSVAYHVLAMVALHVLQPEVSPLSAMVGAYLAGPYQTLSRTTFLAFALAFGALAVGVGSSLTGRRSFAATALLGFSALGFGGVFLFPERVTQVGAVVRPITLATMLRLSLVLRREPRWAPRGGGLVVVSVSLVLLFVVTFGWLLDLGLGGLANRVVLVLIYIWIVLVAWGLFGAPQDLG